MEQSSQLSAIPALLLTLISFSYSHTAESSEYLDHAGSFAVTENMPAPQQNHLSDENDSLWIIDNEIITDPESVPQSTFDIFSDTGSAAAAFGLMNNAVPPLHQEDLMEEELIVDTDNPIAVDELEHVTSD